jgi:hypothetical protein
MLLSGESESARVRLWAGQRESVGGMMLGYGVYAESMPQKGKWSREGESMSWEQGCWEDFCGTGRGSASAGFERPKSPTFLRLVPAQAPPVPVKTSSTTASHQP